MGVLVSIIVPVYNIEDYIEDCIQSIVAQDYTDKELILVDDGSTDSSAQVCDKYRETYPWIKVIHKTNGGLSSARNCGIEGASGDYLLFVDGDDYIHEQHLSLLIGVMNTYQADIVVCDFEKIYSKTRLNPNIEENSNIKFYEGLEGAQALLYQNKMTTSAWGKLYHRGLFKDIQFPIGKLHEDVGTIYKVFFRAEKVVYVPWKLYGYVQHSQSIVHSEFSPKKMDYIELTKEMVSLVEQKYPSVACAAYSRHFSACFQVMAMIPKGEYKAERQRLIGEIKKYRGVVLKDIRARYKNRVAALLSYINVDVAIWMCRVILGGKRI